MTNEIIEKIYNGEELTSEEKVFVSKKLLENAPIPIAKRGRKKASSSPTNIFNLPPFNHKAKQATEACQLTNVHYDIFNKEMRLQYDRMSPEKQSQAVELYERGIQAYPMGLRIVLKELIDLKSNPMNMLGLLLGGRGGSGDGK